MVATAAMAAAVVTSSRWPAAERGKEGRVQCLAGYESGERWRLDVGSLLACGQRECLARVKSKGILSEEAKRCCYSLLQMGRREGAVNELTLYERVGDDKVAVGARTITSSHLLHCWSWRRCVAGGMQMVKEAGGGGGGRGGRGGRPVSLQCPVSVRVPFPCPLTDPGSRKLMMASKYMQQPISAMPNADGRSDDEKEVEESSLPLPELRSTSAAGVSTNGSTKLSVDKAVAATGEDDNDQHIGIEYIEDDCSDSERHRQELLASKIASGEFTVDRDSVLQVLVKARQFLSRFGGGVGRQASLMLARAERQWRLALQEKLPEARGDIKSIVGEPFFVPLYNLHLVYGGAFRLSFGPRSFVIISDPAIAKYILRENAKMYSKGILGEILEFVMGQGLIPADGEVWKTRRRAIIPALHKKYVEAMISLFVQCADKLCKKLGGTIDTEERLQGGRGGWEGGGPVVDMEAEFSRLTLDVIGKAVFNYEFDSLTKDSGVIQAVYTTLTEAGARSTAIVPYWKIGLLRAIVPRQRRVAAAMDILNTTLDELIDTCKKLVEKEDTEFSKEYLNEEDPSILSFLLASGEEVNSKQLRDDLITLLIAGHETGAAVLTWATYLLALHPDKTAKMQEEVDRVLGDRVPCLEDFQKLKYTTRVINEAMRLYPQPPVLIRRALEDDRFGNYIIAKGTDVFISVWNLHRSPDLWERSLEFCPERWPLDGPDPTDVTENFRYLPFGGGSRKCIGDQFATFEMLVTMSMLARRFNFALLPNSPPMQMKVDATIHTKDGLYMKVMRRRHPVASSQPHFTSDDKQQEPVLAVAAAGPRVL